MLRDAKSIEGWELHARDGRLGHVHDLFFDDQHWEVRYFVADTGGWLKGRRVLISTAATEAIEAQAKPAALNVDLTCEQVRNSPGLDTEQPVSSRDELMLLQYYNWPLFSGMAGYADGALGMAVPPPVLPPEELNAAVQQRVAHSAAAEHHLRSVRQVTGCVLEAADGALGHVHDFIVDDANWEIRYLVIDTRNWWPGKKVLIAPAWIERLGWKREKVFTDLRRETIKAGPAYDSLQPITAEYADRLHDHYERPRHRIREKHRVPQGTP